MNSSEEEQIYSIALTMVPGIGHIGAKHLIDGMGNADRKSTRLNSSHIEESRMPSSA